MATTKKARKEWSENEKRANFKQAASKRTSRVIKALRALAGVARTSRYSWTPEDVTKILTAIGGECDALNARFRNPAKARGGDVFTL